MYNPFFEKICIKFRHRKKHNINKNYPYYLVIIMYKKNRRISNFVDISRFVVYNALVYVLMEFRGHTKISTLI